MGHKVRLGEEGSLCYDLKYFKCRTIFRNIRFPRFEGFHNYLKRRTWSTSASMTVRSAIESS
jgi:hypothetical protein